MGAAGAVLDFKPWTFPPCLSWILPLFPHCCVVGRSLSRLDFCLEVPHSRLWIFVGFALQVQVVASVSHGLALVPRNTGDKRRAELRSSVTLPEGRPVLGRTELHRDRLPGDFDRWLKDDGLALDSLIGTAEVDIEFLNLQLDWYGRSLFLSGRPYGHYAETINGGVHECAACSSRWGSCLRMGEARASLSSSGITLAGPFELGCNC